VGLGSQFHAVGLTHVGKANAEAWIIRAHQRVASRQIDVIGDEHESAGLESEIYAARSVGNDQSIGTQPPHYLNREYDLLSAISLIHVRPPGHYRYVLAFETAEDELAGVTGGGRDGKVWDLAIGKNYGVRNLVGERSKPGPKDERNPWTDSSPLLYPVRGFMQSVISVAFHQCGGILTGGTIEPAAIFLAYALARATIAGGTIEFETAKPVACCASPRR